MNTEKIYAEFKDDLYGFILSRVKDSQVAKDILQEVFIKIHLNISKLKSENKLTSWLYQITRNAIVDYFRKTKPGAPLVDLADENQESASYLDFEKCMLRFVTELPEKYREALVKTELGTLSQKEYAAEAGISYSGAKSRVQRAKEELKELFVACCATKNQPENGEIEFKDPKDCTC